MTSMRQRTDANSRAMFVRYASLVSPCFSLPFCLPVSLYPFNLQSFPRLPLCGWRPLFRNLTSYLVIPLSSDLQPLRTFLRTKRSKRCRTCRHILVKPEPKVISTRFRIRLLAV